MLTNPKLVQKHDHSVFVALDEWIHSFHVWLLRWKKKL